MRMFPYITLGRVLEELEDEGLPLSRAAFYRLEKRLDLPKGQRTSGQIRWRVYSAQQKETIKKLLKKEYNIEDSTPGFTPALA